MTFYKWHVQNQLRKKEKVISAFQLLVLFEYNLFNVLCKDFSSIKFYQTLYMSFKHFLFFFLIMYQKILPLCLFITKKLINQLNFLFVSRLYFYYYILLTNYKTATHYKKLLLPNKSKAIIKPLYN